MTKSRPQRKVVTVYDRMQGGYRYSLVAPEGRGFHPEFRPELTPKEMLALGVFCGKYMTDCRKEFPTNWFSGAKLSPGRRDCSLNYFGLNASQPLSVWHPDDPRGWFQWYCRYYMGRRMPEEDARQIRRWKAIRRHVAQVRRNCEPGDQTCRPRQRQACSTGPMTVGKSERIRAVSAFPDEIYQAPRSWVERASPKLRARLSPFRSPMRHSTPKCLRMTRRLMEPKAPRYIPIKRPSAKRS
jgi:hypothetical protein